MTENSNLNPNQNTEKAIKTSHFSVTYSYPFGMPMPNRTYSLSSSKYRFGYQGSEKDNEIYGEGNAYTTHFRMLDPRIGRWFSTDPKENEMPWQSPYNSMNGNPILLNDILGDVPGDTKKTKENTSKTNTDTKAPSNEKSKNSTLSFKDKILLKMIQFGKAKLEEKDKKGEFRYHAELATDLLIMQTNEIVTDKAFNPTVVNCPKVQYSVGAKETFSVKSNKFNYFFGRVTVGEKHNTDRSAQNINDLPILGIKNEGQLMKIFEKAMTNNGKYVKTTYTKYGTNVTRSVEIGKLGRIEVGFHYKGGDMTQTPSVVTLIPKIYYK